MKSVGRVLRSLGLQDAAAEFTDGQVAGFRTQTLILNDLQLEFEAEWPQFGEAGLRNSRGDHVVRDLHTIAQYLHDVLKNVWESYGRDAHIGPVSSRSPVLWATSSTQ